jgi:peptidoglycan biosynthesis protein MviN/MurJ (putative lipid II flippase)
VLLNLLLLPAFGLYGCVLAAAGGALICLLVVLGLNRRHGMTIDRGVWLLAVSPAALGLGPWPAVIATAALATFSLASNALLTEPERRQLWAFLIETLSKFLPLRLRTAISG